jgi:hypothetical protein
MRGNLKLPSRSRPATDASARAPAPGGLALRAAAGSPPPAPGRMPPAALGDIRPPRLVNEDGAPRAQGHRPGHRDPRSMETKGSKAVVLEFEEPVGILEWLASRAHYASNATTSFPLVARTARPFV